MFYYMKNDNDTQTCTCSFCVTTRTNKALHAAGIFTNPVADPVRRRVINSIRIGEDGPRWNLEYDLDEPRLDIFSTDGTKSSFRPRGYDTPDQLASAVKAHLSTP